MLASMRLSFLQPAPDGARFTPDSWDSQIGKTVPFNVGERVSRCTLVAARVSDDGSAVELTIDTADLAPEQVHMIRPGRRRDGMSFSFEPIPAEPA
jgi:hypothetical protein